MQTNLGQGFANAWQNSRKSDQPRRRSAHPESLGRRWSTSFANREPSTGKDRWSLFLAGRVFSCNCDFDDDTTANDHFWYLLGHEAACRTQRCLGGQPLRCRFSWRSGHPFEDKTETEKRADLFAENFLVDKRDFNNSLQGEAVYSKQKIQEFRGANGLHPPLSLVGFSIAKKLAGRTAAKCWSRFAIS